LQERYRLIFIFKESYCDAYQKPYTGPPLQVVRRQRKENPNNKMVIYFSVVWHIVRILVI
jgi:cell division protein FtsL